MNGDCAYCGATQAEMAVLGFACSHEKCPLGSMYDIVESDGGWAVYRHDGGDRWAFMGRIGDVDEDEALAEAMAYDYVPDDGSAVKVAGEFVR